MRQKRAFGQVLQDVACDNGGARMLRAADVARLWVWVYFGAATQKIDEGGARE
jgi:hypothetical protein